MTQFITDPATVYGLLGYAIFASLACGLNFILWRIAHNENERNSDLADQLDYKVSDLTALLDDSKAANKTLTETNAHLSDILSRAYVRNKCGILQRYDDWAINGDKKPKPRRTHAQKIKEMGDHFISEVEKIKNPKPMTRAEYVRALLKEAAESDEFKNEAWPMSALEQMDDCVCNNNNAWDTMPPLSIAIWTFTTWYKTKEKDYYWRNIADSEAVKSFKSKTQWVK